MSEVIKGGTGATPQKESDRRARNKVKDGERTPFKLMTIAELRTWAQRFDVVGYGRMRKAELSDAVQLAFATQG